MMKEQIVHILIVTSYFAIHPSEISGGIGERYVGLYGSFIRKFSKKYSVHWHSRDDGLLHEFDDKSRVCRSMQRSLPFAILSLAARSLKSKLFQKPLIVLMAYPYAMHRPLESLISLTLLAFFSFFRVIVIIVDDFDPPIEAHVTWNDHIPLKLLLGLKTLESVVFKLAKLVIFPSKSYKIYFSSKYKRFASKFRMIPNGSLIDVIVSRPPKLGELTILYSGSLYPIKDVPRLIKCVKNLRIKGLKLHLMLTGQLGMKLENKPWIDYRGIEKNWLSWVKNVLEQADVCVLPYPHRVHWNLTHLAKISDYMAAGKPVISTNLTETSRIFRKYKCGLVANDWRHFEELVVKLYEDRELAVNIGKAARRTVEKHFDYRKLAEELEKLIKPFAYRR